MEIAILIFGIYVFLAVFNAGNMTTLQIQHYGIYHFVGKENFKEYMKANNQAALIPSILPALLLLIINIIMFFLKPRFLSSAMVIFTFSLNLMVLISTVLWQRKIQGQMALEGYDEIKVSKLISTNWIRTIIFLLQSIIAVYILIKAASGNSL